MPYGLPYHCLIIEVFGNNCLPSIQRQKAHARSVHSE